MCGGGGKPWEYEGNQTDGMEADNEIRRHMDGYTIIAFFFFLLQSRINEERSE